MDWISKIVEQSAGGGIGLAIGYIFIKMNEIRRNDFKTLSEQMHTFNNDLQEELEKSKKAEQECSDNYNSLKNALLSLSANWSKKERDIITKFIKNDAS